MAARRAKIGGMSPSRTSGGTTTQWELRLARLKITPQKQPKEDGAAGGAFCEQQTRRLPRPIMIAESLSPGNIKSEEQHRRDICTVGRWIHARNFVAATDGNISVRIDSTRVLTSPTGIGKGMMMPDDLVITNLEGYRLSGCRAPSSELGMHLLIYRRRPDISAVCHAHPPIATGYAAAGVALNKAIVSEVLLSLGCIPVAPYAMPGTPELSDELDPFVQNYDALLMANHGVVTYGPDLLTAFFRMETVEHFAQVSLVTETLGKQTLLSGHDVEKLLAARARHGSVKTSKLGPICPVTSESEVNHRVSITRDQLQSLIEEAIERALRKDREPQ
jgi:L-fuculose-phosphate aldolase